MEELVKIHNSICPEHELHPPIIQLSLDGVMESKSSLNTLDIYTVKFNNCRAIYPIRIIKPCNKYKFDEQLQLKNVLDDINSTNVIIDCGVFDNLKRSTAFSIKKSCG